jgi:hypothetical protein
MQPPVSQPSLYNPTSNSYVCSSSHTSLALSESPYQIANRNTRQIYVHEATPPYPAIPSQYSKPIHNRHQRRLIQIAAHPRRRPRLVPIRVEAHRHPHPRRRIVCRYIDRRHAERVQLQTCDRGIPLFQLLPHRLGQSIHRPRALRTRRHHVRKPSPLPSPTLRTHTQRHRRLHPPAPQPHPTHPPPSTPSR